MKNCVLGIRRFLQVSGPIRASRSRSWTTSRAAAPPSPRSRSAPAAAAAPARACARRSPAPASRSGLGSASPNTSPARMLSAQQKTFLQGSCSDAKPARASRSASRLGLAYVAVEDGEPWVACLPLAHPVLTAHASVSVYRRQKASRKGGQRAEEGVVCSSAKFAGGRGGSRTRSASVKIMQEPAFGQRLATVGGPS